MSEACVTTEKVRKVHVSDEVFLNAVYSSTTYPEIAEKTGQKLSTVITRYARTKAALSQKGITLPAMQRRKPVRKVDNIEVMADIARRLQSQRNS